MSKRLTITVADKVFDAIEKLKGKGSRSEFAEEMLRIGLTEHERSKPNGLFPALDEVEKDVKIRRA